MRARGVKPCNDISIFIYSYFNLNLISAAYTSIFIACYLCFSCQDLCFFWLIIWFVCVTGVIFSGVSAISSIIFSRVILAGIIFSRIILARIIFASVILAGVILASVILTGITAIA